MFSRYVMIALLLGLTLAYDSQPSHDDHENYEDEFEDDSFVRDQEHLKGHMDGMEYDWENAKEHEYDFMFFKLHDTDNNDFLDGLEILASLQHKQDHTNVTEPAKTGADLNKKIGVVDVILEKDDLNHDGYLSYPEYEKARVAGKTIGQPLTNH